MAVELEWNQIIQPIFKARNGDNISGLHLYRLTAGCKESPFCSLPFGLAVASMY